MQAGVCRRQHYLEERDTRVTLRLGRNTSPTHGVTEMNLYWPMKVDSVLDTEPKLIHNVKFRHGGDPIVVRLRFWDAGVWCLTDER